MTDIWYDDELAPDPQSVEELTQGTMGPNEAQQLAAIRRMIRIQEPRAKALDAARVASLAVSSDAYNYVLVRLGCEFDPARKYTGKSFVSARYEGYLWGSDEQHPRVYSLEPVKVDAQSERKFTFEVAPEITVGDIGGKLGSIGAEIVSGHVEPVMRGYAGEQERQPYWTMEHHSQAPLEGQRNFWLLLEIPAALTACYLTCRVEGYLQTRFGKLLLRSPKREFAERPRFTITM